MPGATARARTSKSTPTPATVWAAGAIPIDLTVDWPIPILRTIVTSFSPTGGHVALLPWPSTDTSPRLAVVSEDGTFDRASAAAPTPELAGALHEVTKLGRTGRVMLVAAPDHPTEPVPPPYATGLSDRLTPIPVTNSGAATAAVDANVTNDAPDTDLIITSLRPQHGDEHAGDVVALLAARLLRVGGILVVLTHCDWSGGELVDPTGPVVTAAQNADLLYLQHIIALHTPIHGGEFAAELDGPAVEWEARARHRAEVRGLPVPHRRVHSDVLVFANPHDPHPPRLADAVSETGAGR